MSEDTTQFDPDTLQLLRDRFDLIQRLMFKHHVNDYSELLTIRDELSTKVNSFTTIDDTIAVKSSELEQAKSHLTALAKVISERRLSAKVDFENDVTVILRQLAMPHAVFVVECVETDSLCATGKDKVRFLFSANKGVRPDEMSRVASGGELSRLMLDLCNGRCKCRDSAVWKGKKPDRRCVCSRMETIEKKKEYWQSYTFAEGGDHGDWCDTLPVV